MSAEPTEAEPVQARRLAGWNVLPGGTQICLDLALPGGGNHRLVVPFDALSGLMMTLPRMLQAALDERFGNGSYRVVQQLGTWRLEQAATDSGLILKLGTTDGFDVAFFLSLGQAASLGDALINPSHETFPPAERRPN